MFGPMRELQEVTDLVPELSDIQLLGPETTWVQLSHFAIRRERKRKMITDKQKAQAQRALSA